LLLSVALNTAIEILESLEIKMKTEFSWGSCGMSLVLCFLSMMVSLLFTYWKYTNLSLFEQPITWLVTTIPGWIAFSVVLLVYGLLIKYDLIGDYSPRYTRMTCMTILFLMGLCILLPFTWLALNYDNQIKNPSSEGYFDRWFVDMTLSVLTFCPWILSCQKVSTYALRIAYHTWFGYYQFYPNPRMALKDNQGNYQYVPVVSIRLLKCKVFLHTPGLLIAWAMFTLLWFPVREVIP
jgi:magnesium-transporting ATPase (P-type)